MLQHCLWSLVVCVNSYLHDAKLRLQVNSYLHDANLRLQVNRYLHGANPRPQVNRCLHDANPRLQVTGYLYLSMYVHCICQIIAKLFVTNLTKIIHLLVYARHANAIVKCRN